MTVRIKRIYDSPTEEDGYRVLVDRLWPRGVSKERAALDLWLKTIAPSPELRVWFGHDPKKFSDFSLKYTAELQTNTAVKELHDIVRAHKTVTLLYGAKDPAVNHALVLKNFITKS